jgi:HAD superfamily hydrolase (TIGR01509 family)
MKKCVIFDMDGVIIDSEPIHQECEKKLFGLLGINIPEEEHNTMVGTTDEVMWSRISNLYSLPVQVPEIISLKKMMYMEQLKREVYIRPIPYVSELIFDLAEKGYYLALASSAPNEQIECVLGNLSVGGYFGAVVSGEDVENGKPHPEIFLKTASKAGFEPHECIVIEDSFNGVTAAKKAGMYCIGYINPNSGKQNLDKADIKIRSFKELSARFIEELVY